MIGLGMQEILVLGVLGGGVVLVAVVLVIAGRGRRSTSMEAENRRLRDENERLRERG